MSDDKVIDLAAWRAKKELDRPEECFMICHVPGVTYWIGSDGVMRSIETDKIEIRPAP